MEKTDVNGKPVAGAGKDNLNPNPDEGKSPSEKEIENRVRENLRGEYERKAALVQERLDEATSRLEELEEKDRLTAAEKAEKGKLENQVEGLEDGLYQLEHDPKYAVMAEKFRRTKREAVAEATESVKKELALENSQQLAALYLEIRAEKEEGLTSEKLESEIEAIVKADWDYFKRLMPYERARKAYAIRMRESSYSKKLKELEEKGKKDSFIEDSTTTPKAEKSTSKLIEEGDLDAALSRI